MTPSPLRIVIIDDEPLQGFFWRTILQKRYGERIRVELYEDPREAIDNLKPDIALLVIDWIMPGMDGEQVLNEARKRKVDPKRIIIFSGRPASELHQTFKLDDCLAVIQKGDPQQVDIFLNIIKEIADLSPGY